MEQLHVLQTLVSIRSDLYRAVPSKEIGALLDKKIIEAIKLVKVKVATE